MCFYNNIVNINLEKGKFYIPLFSKLIFITTLLLFFKFNVFSQNAIYNGGFEKINICENNKKCCPVAWYSTNISHSCGFNQDKSHRGQSSVQLTLFNPQFRQRFYLQSKLIFKLIKGEQYKISLFANFNVPLLNNIQIAFNEFRIDTIYPIILNPINSISYLLPIKNILTLESNRYLNSNKWNKFTFLYTANGTEQFVFIGNFTQEDSLINYTKNNIFINYKAYVDDISIIPQKKDHSNKNSVLNYKLDNARHNYYNSNYNNYDSISLKINNKNDKSIFKPIYIQFSFNNYYILDSAKIQLQSIINLLKKDLNLKIKIIGHTDEKGSDTFNFILAKKRAEVIKDYILSNEINNQRISVFSEGKNNPLSSIDEYNRIVEIILYIEGEN